MGHRPQAPILAAAVTLVLCAALLAGASTVPVASPSATASPSAAQHADVAGTWDVTIQGEAYTFDMIAEIAQEGTELTGTLAGPNGVRDLSGTVDGNRVTFSVTIESPEGDFDIEFTGELEDETLSGTMVAGDGELTAPWTARRRESPAR